MANGEPLPNLGEKLVESVDKDGNQLATKYQIAEVTRPLNSISEICDNNSRVVFARGGGFIFNVVTGAVTPFARRGKLYELDHWIRKPTNSASPAKPSREGF